VYKIIQFTQSDRYNIENLKKNRVTNLWALRCCKNR